jgi:hypothetical protein
MTLWFDALSSSGPSTRERHSKTSFCTSWYWRRCGILVSLSKNDGSSWKLPNANRLKDRNLPEISESFNASLQSLGTDGEPLSKLYLSPRCDRALIPSRLHTRQRRRSNNSNLRPGVMETHHALPVRRANRERLPQLPPHPFRSETQASEQPPSSAPDRLVLQFRNT